MTNTAAPVFATGDCHVGDCQRPVDHAGRHGHRTVAEQASAARHAGVPADARPEPDWDALYREAAEKGI